MTDVPASDRRTTMRIFDRDTKAQDTPRGDPPPLARNLVPRQPRSPANIAALRRTQTRLWAADAELQAQLGIDRIRDPQAAEATERQIEANRAAIARID